MAISYSDSKGKKGTGTQLVSRPFIDATSQPGILFHLKRAATPFLFRSGSGLRVRAPIREERLGHPLIGQLILEGGRLGPVPRFYQALDLSGVLSGDGAANRLIACSTESHRQHPELVRSVGSRSGIGCHGKPPFHRHRPNRRLGKLGLPGSALNSSIRPLSSGSPSHSI